MKIEIFPATETDAAEIQNVFQSTWLDTYPNEEHKITLDDIKDYFNKKGSVGEQIEKWKERIKNLPETQKCLVAKVQGKVVGVCRTNETDEVNKLQALYILPEFQRKGIGGLLWDKAKKFFNPSKDITVRVTPYNTKAVEFYKKLGFKKTTKKYFTEDKLKMKSGAFIPEMVMVIRV